MSKQIQIRRGSATEHENFTGAIGEITMDTTNVSLRIHDGKTVGGIHIARSDMKNLTNAEKTAIVHMMMPSSKYIELTLNSGEMYTAPSDGYIWLQSGETANTQLFIDVFDSNNNLLYGNGAIFNFGGVFIPIAHNHKALIKYTNKQFLRFIYAMGSY